MPKKSYDKPVSETKARYHAYLKSSEWEEFKRRKESLEPKACRHCGSTAVVQLHHMIYRDTPQESRLEDTIWLCQVHHKAWHAHKSGSMKRKTPPSVLIEKTLKALRQYDLRRKRNPIDGDFLDEPAWNYAPSATASPAKKIASTPVTTKVIVRMRDLSGEEKLQRQIDDMERGLNKLKAKLESLKMQPKTFDGLIRNVRKGSVLK